jgi:phosphate/sulfate permease
MGLPPIPLVPVSSSQVIVGSVLGIGFYRGVRNINFNTLWTIVSGWVTTPIIAGVISFISLFIVQNVFNIKVVSATGRGMLQPGYTGGGMVSVNATLLVIIVVVSAVAILFVGLWLNEKRKNKKIL